MDQRIAVRYALPGMSLADTADCITHHCKIAGRADTLFSADSVTLIHNAARGYPRAVNNLAVQALTAAFAAGHAIVDEKAARIAVTDNPIIGTHNDGIICTFNDGQQVNMQPDRRPRRVG